MSEPLTIAPNPRYEDSPGLTVRGEIDQNNAHLLRQALQDAIADDRRVELDLTGVTYLDSAGLAVLFAEAGRIRILAPALLRPVMEISGLTSTCPVEIVDRPAAGTGTED